MYMSICISVYLYVGMHCDRNEQRERQFEAHVACTILDLDLDWQHGARIWVVIQAPQYTLSPCHRLNTELTGTLEHDNIRQSKRLIEKY